ncbi:hypothetical protein KIW84_076098 [Lathyrus oleraceus]|uniref:Apple domain-containing protein n=2 Tax=Pisum sativum TaxID=3888 RepID=A0A9D5A1X4_PEA|nr:hypothetical protein KIW84_076098 [Pisum sativum]
MDAVGREAQLRGFEFARAVTLVAEPFAMENGLLTPTMKIKRPQVKQYFAKAISDMYNEISISDPSLKPLLDDKPDGTEDSEEEVLPGRVFPHECKPELHMDYDGSTVKWGLTHHKDSAADCCQACLDHAKRAKEGEKKCNIWVYCPSEFGCHSPDVYQHKHQECWLKSAEKPKLNFKNRYPEWYRNSHPSAPTADTSKVPAHQMPIVSTLTRLFNETSEALGGSRANPAKRREIEDNSKRLGGLFAKLNSGDISKNASDKLLQLCQALDNGDFGTALQIQ